jgi:hypothetical protein
MSNIAANRRWLIWLALLGAAMWLAVFGDKTPSESAVISPSSLNRDVPKVTLISGSQNSNKTNGLQLTALDSLIPRQTLIEERKTGVITELFASSNWNPPPPPVKQLPPAPPMAPALPFTFIGKKLEAGVWEVFLGRGEQSFVAKEGIIIEGTYRVEKILPPNLNLTYLPLGQTQNLPIGTPE